MTKQFNVGDTVKYTSPFNGWITNGVVKTVQISNSQKVYDVTWEGHNNDESEWICGDNLSLVNAEGIPTVAEAKNLKVELESKILQLIQEFNKKTNLEVKDVDLDCYRTVGGECFYQVSAKVEI